MAEQRWQLLSHFNTHSAESKTCQFLSLRQMDQHERWIYNKSKDIADMEKGIAHPHAISPIVSLLMGCVVLSALWEVGSAKTV